MQKCIRRMFILVVILVVGAASAHAGGLWLYEEATPDMGVGGAGRQAAGFDASTAGGNDGGNAGYFTPAGSLYYVHSVNPDLKLGLWVGSYFGLGLSYSNEWAGRYYVQRTGFTTAAVNPSIGYRIAPWLSIGGGVSVVYGQLSDRVAVNTLAEPGDGRLKYDADDVGYGFNFGALFEWIASRMINSASPGQFDCIMLRRSCRLSQL